MVYCQNHQILGAPHPLVKLYLETAQNQKACQGKQPLVQPYPKTIPIMWV